MKAILKAGLVVAFAFPAPFADGQQEEYLIELIPLPDTVCGFFMVPTDINIFGEVVGNAEGISCSEPFYWDDTLFGKTYLLPTLDSDPLNDFAEAINDLSTIALRGEKYEFPCPYWVPSMPDCADGSALFHGYVLSYPYGIQDLTDIGTLSSCACDTSALYDINSYGETPFEAQRAVGSSFVVTNQLPDETAIYWEGSLVNVSALVGKRISKLTAIADADSSSGIVSAGPSRDTIKGCAQDPLVAISVGGFTVLECPGEDYEATDISDSDSNSLINVVTGHGFDETLAMIWVINRSTGTLLQRIVLEDEDSPTAAYAVSRAQRTVVGTANDDARRWTLTGPGWTFTSESLDDLIFDPGDNWNLQAATGINDVGQIVGYGYYQGSPGTAFILHPLK